MKYSVIKGQQQEDVLLIDGKQSICPYTAPIPFQGNMGQLQIMRMPCCTLCPHADMTESGNEMYYSINCSANGRKDYKLEGGESDKPTSKLVSL